MKSLLSRSAVAMLTGAFVIAATPQQSGNAPILGFTSDHAREQHALESRLDGQVNSHEMLGWLEQLASQPNHVGAPHDRANAEWMADRFREWGFDTRIDTYQVLFPTPTDRLLELVGPTTFRARLREATLSQDRTSGIVDGRLPPYNAYSADGDVTGELVYVNYGVPDDYKELERRGVSVEGKIVIARYGGSWRGIKPKVAHEHGAIGCIIYSDPRDDGYWQGDVYPEGPWRMEYGAQRGSVEDMPVYPGDPLTPGRAATENAQRMTVQESPVIMKIPVLPISYADAQPLLEALQGPVAPPSWRGALPLTYHIGPGPARVHLRLAFDWSLKPLYDVIATLRGSDSPDEWVVRGNHHDAWVFGADDPLSGAVALMAEAMAVGQLARSGWRPKRTIVYALWDGEEPGLLGSTEWAEDHADELRQKAVAYLNTDSNGRGFFGVGGSHALARFVTEVARDVTDPETNVSALERVRARLAAGTNRDIEKGDLSIGALGSGSDYTPFLQHLSISSINAGYGGEGGGGSYHSIFDSFDWYIRFGDPELVYGAVLAKTMGRMTLRLADADVLPYRFQNLSSTVSDYANEVMKLADDMRQGTERHNRLVASNAFRIQADPTETYVAPDSEAAVPYLNFAPLQNAVRHLDDAAKAYDEALATSMASGGPTGRTAQRLNALLRSTERTLGDTTGLPRRPWFRHTIYAPGFYTGYGVKTLPGIREAIEQRAWDEATVQIPRVAAALERLAGVLEQAKEVLGG